MGTEHDHGTVNFDMLVAHYCVAFQGPDTADREERQTDFRSMLADFESNEGKVKSQYWCSNIQAGAVLTDRDRFFSAGDPYRTAADLPLARLVGRADTFARVADELLTGSVRRTGLELIYAIETNALGCMDDLASTPPYAPPRAAELRKVTIAKIRDDLAIAQDYLEAAMGRAARLIYLQGVLWGIGIVVAFVLAAMALFAVLPNNFVDGTEFVPSILVFGALGAAVSVMQRLTQGNLRVRLEPGPSTVRLLGAFRPIIGAVLALAILTLILGGLIPLTPPSGPAQKAFFLAGLAFLSGFSERYAQDMLGAGKTASISANTLGPAPVE